MHVLTPLRNDKDMRGRATPSLQTPLRLLALDRQNAVQPSSLHRIALAQFLSLLHGALCRALRSGERSIEIVDPNDDVFDAVTLGGTWQRKSERRAVANEAARRAALGGKAWKGVRRGRDGARESRGDRNGGEGIVVNDD